MPKKISKFCWHFSAWSIKTFGFFALCLFMLCAVFIWRVNDAPLDISFAKPYIQEAMRDSETGNYAVFDQAVLYWPNLSGPLYLEFMDAELKNKEGYTLLSIRSSAISFSELGILRGRIMPEAIILKEPALHLTRDETGSFDFGLGTAQPETIKDDRFELTTRIFGYIARPGVESANDSLISKLKSFRIVKANLIIDDQIAQQSWSLPDFNAGIYSTHEGMVGKIKVRLPSVGLDKSSLSVDMKYIWDQKTVAISADVNNVDVQSLAEKVPELGMLSDQDMVVNAHVETLLDDSFIPTDVRVSVVSSEGSIYHEDLSEEAIPYADLELHAVYNYPSKMFKLDDTEVTLGGVTVNFEGGITYDERKVGGPLRLWIDEAAHDLVPALWPNILRGDNSETWIVKRMSGGRFKDVSVTLDFQADKILGEDGLSVSWIPDVNNVLATFACENMRVDYRAPLAAAENVYGSGSFDLNTDELLINIDRGTIGAMKVSKASMVFDKVVAVGEGGADIDVTFPKVGIANVMRYISGDPINLGQDIEMDLSQVKGDANLNVRLRFPTHPDVEMEDFDIDVNATLRDVLFPDVLEEFDLSGGPYDFNLTNGLATIKGKGLLENREIDLKWQRYLESKGKPFKERVTAKITADPNIRTMLGIDLSDFMEGSVHTNIDYTRHRDGSAVADVLVDAAGALFFVEPFDFAKKAGDPGNAVFKAHFQNGMLKKITDLTASGTGFEIYKTEIDFTQKDEKTELAFGNVSYFSLGETKGVFNFSFDDLGTAVMTLNAQVLDARPFMAPKNSDIPYEEPPMKINVKANKVISAPGQAIYDTRIYMDIDEKGRFNHMEADARIEKSGQVNIRFKPDGQGKRIFLMRSNNAGGLLKAFQVYNDIIGGDIVIYGEPNRGVFDRNINGRAELTNFKVVNEPSLTKILSVLSLTGIGDALANDGLSFKKLESDFGWVYRPGGSLLIMKNGRTSGNSLGLLFEGTVDNQKRIVDVSGTVVPMDGLNKIIGSIPLVGDILTGGTGGVFAATYKIKGSTEAPVISVNPLSVIAPGIIRRVVFE